jgi:hypothetical protein
MAPRKNTHGETIICPLSPPATNPRIIPAAPTRIADSMTALGRPDLSAGRCSPIEAWWDWRRTQDFRAVTQPLTFQGFARVGSYDRKPVRLTPCTLARVAPAPVSPRVRQMAVAVGI